MSLPQKRLSMKRYPSLVPQESRQSFDGAELAVRINSTQIKRAEQGTGKRTFLEDFTLEHSLSDTQVTSLELAGSF
jgi:hypothetical protein